MCSSEAHFKQGKCASQIWRNLPGPKTALAGKDRVAPLSGLLIYLALTATTRTLAWLEMKKQLMGKRFWKMMPFFFSPETSSLGCSVDVPWEMHTVGVPGPNWNVQPNGWHSGMYLFTENNHTFTWSFKVRKSGMSKHHFCRIPTQRWGCLLSLHLVS